MRRSARAPPARFFPESTKTAKKRKVKTTRKSSNSKIPLKGTRKTTERRIPKAKLTSEVNFIRTCVYLLVIDAMRM